MEQQFPPVFAMSIYVKFIYRFVLWYVFPCVGEEGGGYIHLLQHQVRQNWNYIRKDAEKAV